MRLAAVMVLMAGLGGAARADEDDETRARAHYEIGLGLYRLGDYRAALREFAAGYELVPKSGFLINLGQTYRKLGDLAHARDMYRRFLADAPASDPQRPQAQQMLAELETQLKAQPPAPPAEVPPPPPPPSSKPGASKPSPSPPSSKPSPLPPPAALSSSAAATATVEAAPTPPPRARRRPLRIAGVTLTVAGVLLAAPAIALGFAADGLARDLNNADRNGAPYDANKEARYNNDRAGEYACIGVGAAFAATGVVLLIVGSR